MGKGTMAKFACICMALLNTILSDYGKYKNEVRISFSYFLLLTLPPTSYFLPYLINLHFRALLIPFHNKIPFILVFEYLFCNLSYRPASPSCLGNIG